MSQDKCVLSNGWHINLLECKWLKWRIHCMTTMDAPMSNIFHSFEDWIVWLQCWLVLLIPEWDAESKVMGMNVSKNDVCEDHKNKLQKRDFIYKYISFTRARGWCFGLAWNFIHIFTCIWYVQVHVPVHVPVYTCILMLLTSPTSMQDMA